jgi:hypothetical protein
VIWRNGSLPFAYRAILSPVVDALPDSDNDALNLDVRERPKVRFHPSDSLIAAVL